MASKIPNNVLLYRANLASDLLALSKHLEKHGINTGGIRTAVSQLKDSTRVDKIKQSDPVDYSFFGYVVNNIEFFFTTPPSHTHPENLENISLKFDITLIGQFEENYSHTDPLKHLEFNLVVIGFKDKKEHIISYHLDRHPEGENESKEAHPKYHFQFGGRKLDKKNKDFGQSIILDSPRVMHYPMDIILGVDFIVSNFFPDTWDKLKKDGDYVSLISDYRDKYMKPFFCSLAGSWTGMLNGTAQWNSQEICPQIF